MKLILSGIKYRDLIGAISGLVVVENFSGLGIEEESNDNLFFPGSNFLTDFLLKLESTLEDFLCGYDDEVTTAVTDYNPVILERYFELSTFVKGVLKDFTHSEEFKLIYCGLDVLVIEFEEE